MYDIKPLEEEWKKYKKKKRKPLFVLVFSIFFILLISLTFLNYKEIDFLKFNDKSKVEIVTNKSTTLLIDKALSTLETRESKVNDTTETESVEVFVEDLPIPEDTNAIKEPRVKIKTVEKSRKKMHLDIIETTSLSAYKDVAKRFNQTHDIDDSLFLAKSYYRKGNYKKAEYWALQTNKVNENIEESWLIFTKSKVKLDRKNEAIRILTAYIKKSNSAEAKSLLDKIKKGTL